MRSNIHIYCIHIYIHIYIFFLMFSGHGWSEHRHSTSGRDRKWRVDGSLNHVWGSCHGHGTRIPRWDRIHAGKHPHFLGPLVCLPSGQWVLVSGKHHVLVYGWITMPPGVWMQKLLVVHLKKQALFVAYGLFFFCLHSTNKSAFCKIILRKHLLYSKLFFIPFHLLFLNYLINNVLK